MTAVKPTELHLNTPKGYDGAPSTAKFWLNLVRTYLLINKDVYSTDDKRVGYALSFMTEGTAKSWAAVCTQNALDAGSFGTFQDFITDFQKSFFNTNSTTEATTWLTNTRVRNDDYLPKYMAEFKLKVVEAELNATTHTATIIHYLRAGILVWLSDWIYGMETVPVTTKGWYEKIDLFLSQRRFAAAVAKQHSSRTPITYHSPAPTKTSPSRDPDTMDVDTKERPRKLTPEERNRCFKEGRCLRCRQKGHMASTCTAYTTAPLLPARPPARPPTKKVAVVETVAQIEEIAEEEEQTIGRLTSQKESFNQDF